MSTPTEGHSFDVGPHVDTVPQESDIVADVLVIWRIIGEDGGNRILFGHSPTRVTASVLGDLEYARVVTERRINAGLETAETMATLKALGLFEDDGEDEDDFGLW